MLVEFDKSFERSLNNVHDNIILKRLKRIIIQIENTQSLAQLRNFSKLTGYSNYYRIRIGVYRVGIELVNNQIIPCIIIAHRKDIYKIFP
jgi:mRNA interferase RelE/StbE